MAITIPEFNFSGFYYPQIFENLVVYKRQNVTEHTDESEFDPYMQFLKMQALVGHLNNVNLDLLANESTLPTAHLTEQVRNMLRLIDYRLRTATPSGIDLVYELSKVFTAIAELIPDNSLASTIREPGTDPVYFETPVVSIDRTDQLSYVLVSDTGDTIFTDFTTKANSQTTPGDDWQPWASDPVMKDSIYFGHKQIMWDKLGVWLTTVAAGITGVWEYYDGNFRKANPDTVILQGGGSQLRFDINEYLGTANRQGTKIRVQLDETTAYEDVFSQWDGVNYVEVGLLGQSLPKYNSGGGSPTTDAETYYSVGSDWESFDNLIDGSVGFTVSGNGVTFDLPQTLLKNWTAGDVDGDSAYWMRFRVISVGAVTLPVFQYVRIDQDKQYVLVAATQGRTNIEDGFESSDGTANQTFQTARDNYISGTMIASVDGEAWTIVDNFLSSGPTDKHAMVEVGENDRASIVFGDGVTGRIPPVGVGNISAEYRWGADTNGNVGANTATVNKSGVTYINKLWNPRAATGWSESQGATEESLERAKVDGPASLRTRTVAISPDDVVKFTTSFVDSDGSVPFARARAFEEGFGPKTIEDVVVTKGGGQASVAQLSALSEYFNGNPYVYPPIEKHVIANQQVIAVNFTPKVLDIEATIYGNVTEAAVTNRLNAVLQPEARRADGTDWEWEFGEVVPVSRLEHEIYQVTGLITKADITKLNGVSPPVDISLQPRELPVLGTLTLTIILPS